MNELSQDGACNKLVKYINDNGGRFADWYCGVTDNVPNRLQEHANEKNISIKLSTSAKCVSMANAVAVESRMHAKGCKGGGGIGGVTSGSDSVYVFRLK